MVHVGVATVGGAVDLIGEMKLFNVENNCDCAGRKGALRVIEGYTCPQMLAIFHP